ncbi:MAG: PRC-barrel domain-containing protein [Acidobacteria bacterium]|nr:PRC-barrel domain-containing protein [Acidobacteriota bacterium]
MNDRAPTGDLDAAEPGHTLKPLSRLHAYEIVEGDPDVRGWAVVGADGRKVGEVSDLLVDTDAGRVRYLDVAVDTDLLDAPAGPGNEAVVTGPGLLGTPAGLVTAHSAMAGVAPLFTEDVVRSTLSDAENALTRDHHLGVDSRHVLIPIGRARLDPAHDRVNLEEFTAGQIAELPAYDSGNLDREAEARVRQAFDRGGAGHAPGGEPYTSPLFDEDRFYGPRRQTSQTRAETARGAGLEAGGATPAGGQGRPITGELDRLDRTVETPEEETAAVPGRGARD